MSTSITPRPPLLLFTHLLTYCTRPHTPLRTSKHHIISTKQLTEYAHTLVFLCQHPKPVSSVTVPCCQSVCVLRVKHQPSLARSNAGYMSQPPLLQLYNMWMCICVHALLCVRAFHMLCVKTPEEFRWSKDTEGVGE